MPVKDLTRLVNVFAGNAARAEVSFESGGLEARAFAVITLYADWEEFCRRLLFASAISKPVAADGRRIDRAPGMRTHRDVELALKSWKRRRPNQPLVLHLGSPRTMVEACKQLSLANEQTITPAVLSQGSPADDLRLVRNYLAHQNPSTAAQVRSGPTMGNLEVRSLVAWLGHNQGAGRTRFGVWAGAMTAVARACAN